MLRASLTARDILFPALIRGLSDIHNDRRLVVEPIARLNGGSLKGITGRLRCSPGVSQPDDQVPWAARRSDQTSTGAKRCAPAIS
jgi:hypothetical protein